MLLAFEPHEWELLVRLPARIMIAATSAEKDSDRRTVDEGLAGINAIAAGAGVLLAGSGLLLDSHDGRALANILETVRVTA